MEKFLRYDTPATAFEESLPLGNGSLGAVVYGKTDVERISLNHDTLWSGKPGQCMVEGAKESFEKAKELSLENATSGMAAPFHKGAAKYFAEKGITVESK